MKKGKEIAQYLLDEVKTEPAVKKEDTAKIVIVQFLLALLSVYCVIFNNIDFAEFSYDKWLVVLAMIVAQFIIYPIMHSAGYYGKTKKLLVLCVVMLGTAIKLGGTIRQGFANFLSTYLNYVNDYYNTNLYVNIDVSFDDNFSSNIMLIVVIVFMLLIIDFIFVCNMRAGLFLLFTLPWYFIMPVVGIVPSGILIYVAIVIGLMATGTVKKKRVKLGVVRKNNTQKIFIDDTMIKMVCSTIVMFVVICVVVFLIVPKDYDDKDYMIDRHKNFEKNLQEVSEGYAENKKLDIEAIDRLFGADDIHVGSVEGDDGGKKKNEFVNPIIDYDKAFTSTKGYFDRLIEGSAQFYKGFAHGQLGSVSGKAKISKDKMYTLELTNPGYEIDDLYIKTYESMIYEDGSWKTDSDIDKDYVKELNDEFFKNYNNFIESYWYEGTNGRFLLTLIPEEKTKDSIYPPYFSNGNIFSSNTNKGEQVSFEITNDGVFSKVHEIGGLYQVYDKYENIVYRTNEAGMTSRGPFFESYKTADRNNFYAGESLLTENFEFYDEYENLYDVYTQFPEECEELAYEALYRALNEGLFIDDTYYGTEEYTYEQNYNEVARALDIVTSLLREKTYTLEPKKTQNIDPVMDFYYYTDEGFCMHFASTAAIMLRGMGVPAKYVEGYVIPSYEINEKRNTAKEGTTDTFKVDVYGTNAHAWIEVYIKGMGWIPVEMTVGESIDGGSFLDVLEQERNEDKPTKSPTKKPDPQPTKKPGEEETKEPVSTNTPKPQDIEKDNQDGGDAGNENENNNAKTFANRIKIIIAVVIVMTVVIIIYGIRRYEKILERRLKRMKFAYRYADKMLYKAAAKKKVKYKMSMDYTEYAKEFSDADEDISYDTALLLMEVRRRVEFSKEGLQEEDARIMVDIYNGYMDKKYEKSGRFKKKFFRKKANIWLKYW